MNDTLQSDVQYPVRAWRWGVPVVSFVLALFVLFSGTNTALFLAINQAANTLGDGFWSHVTVLGDTAALLLILLFCGRRPQLVWQFFIAALLAILWTQSMKGPLGVLRPPAILSSEQFHLIGTLFQNNSFPSGHTTTTFLVIGVLCLQRFTASIKLLLLLLAILVGLSRIACGVHWPLDVLGGAFGGWMAAVIGQWLSLRWRIGLHDYVQRALAILLLAVALWMIVRPAHEFPMTQPFQVTLALAAILWSGRGMWRLFSFKR
ncbi:MAG: phosphatase PAP2 family protein [Sideroxydans sp.]|nr:phosphatase PAP2 family protein [Sideroxydans sp.]